MFFWIRFWFGSCRTAAKCVYTLTRTSFPSCFTYKLLRLPPLEILVVRCRLPLVRVLLLLHLLLLLHFFDPSSIASLLSQSLVLVLVLVLVVVRLFSNARLSSVECSIYLCEFVSRTTDASSRVDYDDVLVVTRLVWFLHSRSPGI